MREPSRKVAARPPSSSSSAASSAAASEQPFCERDERLGEVPRVRGAEPHLAYDRLRHARVAVADDRDVVVGIEESALRLIDPNAFGADDVDGADVGERSQKSAERVAPP